MNYFVVNLASTSEQFVQSDGAPTWFVITGSEKVIFLSRHFAQLLRTVGRKSSGRQVREPAVEKGTKTFTVAAQKVLNVYVWPAPKNKIRGARRTRQSGTAYRQSHRSPSTLCTSHDGKTVNFHRFSNRFARISGVTGQLCVFVSLAERCAVVRSRTVGALRRPAGTGGSRWRTAGRPDWRRTGRGAVPAPLAFESSGAGRAASVAVTKF